MSLEINWYQTISLGVVSSGTAIVTAMTPTLGSLSPRQRVFGGMGSGSTRTARKRDRALRPHTRAMPTIDSSRSAISAKIRYPIECNLTTCDGTRRMRSRL